MALKDILKHLQRGDQITLHSADAAPVAIEVLAIHVNIAESPLIVDTDGHLHKVNDYDDLYIDKYKDGVPSTRHVYWYVRPPHDEHEVEYHHAIRIGHQNNGVWEYRGKRIETSELLSVSKGHTIRGLVELDSLS